MNSRSPRESTVNPLRSISTPSTNDAVHVPRCTNKERKRHRSADSLKPCYSPPTPSPQAQKKPSLYSILFFPSSALMYLAVLNPRSCLATSAPNTLSLRTLLIVSWYPSVAHGRGLSFGQLTCPSSVHAK